MDIGEELKAISLAPKQAVSFEELCMSQVVSQDALIRLLVDKGIFASGGFLETVRKVNLEKKQGDAIGEGEVVTEDDLILPLCKEKDLGIEGSNEE